MPGVVKELVAKTLACVGTRDEAGHVDQLYRDEPVAVDADRVYRIVPNPKLAADAFYSRIGDAHVRLDRCKSVIGCRHCKLCCCVKEC